MATPGLRIGNLILSVILFGSTLSRASDSGKNVTKIGSVLIYDSPVHLTFSPEIVTYLVEGTIQRVEVNYTLPDEGAWRVQARVRDPANARLVGGADFETTSTAEANATTLLLEGIFLGRTTIQFYIQPLGSNSSIHSGITSANQGDGPAYDVDGWRRLPRPHELPVAVVRRERIIDRLFTVVIATFVLFANIGMGCKIDLGVVREVLRRPFAPAIGFFCQFIFMPLLSFGIIKLLGLRGGVALGFFAMGCSPGGGASNMFTFLLDGDISLSVTMTLISTAASLGMTPMWLFSLGRFLMDDSFQVTIPFQNIIISLVAILVPCAIGILIQKKRPLWAKKIVKILKPVFLIFILFMFTFGIWANLFIFKLFTPILVLAGCLLPYCGFSLGGLSAWILRQPKARIIAICVETGIQNPGVAILLMKFSLPQPDSDLSLVSPVVTSTFTPLPLWIAVASYYIHKRCCKKQADFQEVAKEEEAVEEEMEDYSEKKVLQAEEKKDLNANGTLA